MISFVSLILGAFLGFLYAFFFLFERKKSIKVLNDDSQSTKLFKVGRTALTSGLRLILIFLTFFFVLRTFRVNAMLMLFAFIFTFWLVIIVKESKMHGRR